MSNPERIKAEISFFEKLLIFTLAVIATMTGWMVTGFNTAATWALLLGLFATVTLSVYGLFLYREIRKLLEELDNG